MPLFTLLRRCRPLLRAWLALAVALPLWSTIPASLPVQAGEAVALHEHGHAVATSDHALAAPAQGDGHVAADPAPTGCPGGACGGPCMALFMALRVPPAPVRPHRPEWVATSGELGEAAAPEVPPPIV